MAGIAANAPRALVIGAGPAGSMAGLLLARAGWQVIVVEQNRAARDKVCGECLSHTGLAVLDRSGLRPLLSHAGAIPIPRTLLHPPRSPALAMHLPQPCVGISRRTLDALLLRAARDAGAIIRQPARCEGLIADPPACTVRDLATNQIETIPADVILLADGKGTWGRPKPAATGDLGANAHFADVNGPRDAVELFALDGHYAGLNPVENGGWNLAMSVPADRVRAIRGDWDRLLGSMLEQNGGLARRLGGARRISRWIASPLPRFGVEDRGYPDGVLPIGNAAAAIEPIGGEGMGLALRSAEIAVRAIQAARSAGRAVCFTDIVNDFAALWRLRSRACRAAAIALSHNTLVDPALALLAGNGPLQRAALRLIGK